MWVIIHQENVESRPEAIFASNSKNKVDAKLEDIKNEFKEEFIFDYCEGDCLILNDDDAYYIEKVRETNICD